MGAYYTASVSHDFYSRILLVFQQPLILSTLFPSRLVLARKEFWHGVKRGPKAVFCLPMWRNRRGHCGFREQWGARCYGRANGIGEWADFGRCFGVDDKFFIFVLRGEEKIRLGVGTEAFGVNYLLFSREFMGFSKQTNDGLHRSNPARAIFDAEKVIELI